MCSTTSGFDVKFVVRDVKLDFGFDPKPVWSFTGVSPGELRAVLLVARIASGSVFYTLNNSMQQRNS